MGIFIQPPDKNLPSLSSIQHPALKSALCEIAPNKIYFGYGHVYCEPFVRTIIDLEKATPTSEKTVVVLLAGGALKQIQDILNPIKDALKDHGQFFRQIDYEFVWCKNDVINFNEKNPNSPPKQPNDGMRQILSIKGGQEKGNHLTVCILQSLPHGDMLLLERLSQPLFLATGDQTLSEAISCDKCWVYDYIQHKFPLLYLVYNT